MKQKWLARVTMLLLATLMVAPSIADVSDPQRYARELEAVVDEIRQVFGGSFVEVLGLDEPPGDVGTLQSDLAAMAEGGDYDGFRDALAERELMVTPNPVSAMIVYVHPYVEDKALLAIGQAILDSDVTTLQEMLETTESDLDDSLYLGYSLGYTPLVMAAQGKSLPMVEALLEAGANPNAPSHKSGVRPMQVVRLLKLEEIATALLAAGAK